MNSNIDTYRGGWPVLSRDSIRAGRAVSRRQADNQVRLSGVDGETDLAIEKITSITDATGQAMGAVVRVAQVQKQLEQLAPEASGRLAMLADDHALTLVDVMADLRRQLRRQ